MKLLLFNDLFYKNNRVSLAEGKALVRGIFFETCFEKKEKLK